MTWGGNCECMAQWTYKG